MTTLTKTNSIHRSPLLRGLLLIPLLLVCFALLPRVQAAPDPAAIPGGNTRDGAGSLASRTTGVNNSAFGTNALNKLTEGNNNAAQGNSALFSNVDGNKNTGLGVLALRLNISGDDNTAVGYKALYSNTQGNQNVAVGTQALYSNTDGANNTGLGFQALFSNSGADENTAVGFQALLGDTGGLNTAVGFQALVSNAGGTENTAIGDSALSANIIGQENTAIGFGALVSNTGTANIGLGSAAGSALTTGSFNIDIGDDGVAGDDRTIRIGVVPGGQSKTFIAGITGVVVTGAPVLVSTGGQLGVASSSARFKDEIKPMAKSSEAILALKPVTFRYKQDLDPDRIPQFGLIAEEVEKVNPDLVGRDAKGKVYTVRYEAVNAMLLNEFLKEHREVQEQKATISQLKSTVAKQDATAAHQQKQIEALSAGLQKVSAEVEMSRPAPQMVGNNR